MMKNDDRTAGRAGLAPDLKARTVVGVFDRLDQADVVVRCLQTEGYPVEDLSLVMRPPGSPPEMDAEQTEAQKGTIAGASAGALLGGALGLVALTIPGLGPLIAGGPIVAAISGALAGGAVGAWVGSFTGLGLPTEHAREYEQAVRAGGIFIGVRVPDHAAAERVSGVLSEHGATEVASFIQL
ncbi:MAG: hypothetical protein M5U01_35555 [Ardenticatenaceae bacterium]|nr:hypothetical protein [Ardenticatenaceae bacterium]